MSVIKAYFDQAIALQEGQKLLVPANSFKHMESMRVQFTAQRRKWHNSVATQEEILISRFSQDGRHGVLLEKLAATAPAMILDKDNKIINFVRLEMEETGRVSMPEPETDNEEARMRQAMEEDGLSQEEIDSYFDGGNSNDEA